MKQEYLSKQKQLSNQKLAERLKKRREEKNRLKEKESAPSTSTTSSSASVQPPPPPGAQFSISLSNHTCNEDGNTVGAEERMDRDSEGISRDEMGKKKINLAHIFWVLLTHSRRLAVTREQHKFVYKVVSQRVAKLLQAENNK